MDSVLNFNWGAFMDHTEIRLGRVNIDFAYSVEEAAAALGTHRNVGDRKALPSPHNPMVARKTGLQRR